MPRKPANPALSAMPSPDTEFVYSLTCPVGGMVRYVGRTSNSLAMRLSLHMGQLSAKKQPNPELLYWKQELRSEGLTPIIELLEAPDRMEVTCTERRWTRHFQRLGNPMLNVRNVLIRTSAHGHDLWALNDIADKHNLEPSDVAIAADVCDPTAIAFLSGSKEVSRLAAGKMVQFLHSLPSERLSTENARSHLHGYLAYFLNEQTKAIWTR